MSGEINAISRTQIIIVEPVSGTVSVIYAGPPGPAGPPGTGSGDGLWIESGGTVYLETNPSEIVLQVDDNTNIDIVNNGDITVNANRDVDIAATRDVNIDGPNNVNIMASGGTNEDVNIGASRDVRMDWSGTDQVAIKARNTPAVDARINNQSFVPYLDESTNTLKFRVRLSDGSYKTGTLSIT